MTKNPMQLKAFIKNKAAEKHISAQLVMQNYMLERLLERISLSPYCNSSGAVPRDRHCNISAAIVAAKYQHWLLARWRAAHANLCSGVRAAGLLHFGA